MEPWQAYLLIAVNLTAVIAGVSKGLRVLLEMRDNLRDLTKAVGTEDPPTGFFQDFASLRTDMVVFRRELLTYRDTLIEITSQLGLRRPGGRT